jgi:hypothetical protein
MRRVALLPMISLFSGDRCTSYNVVQKVLCLPSVAPLKDTMVLHFQKKVIVADEVQFDGEIHEDPLGVIRSEERQ